MSRLSRYLRERNALRTHNWLNFLLQVDRTCNAALLLVSLVMFAYAGDLYARLADDDATLDPTWPSSTPPVSVVVLAAMGAAAALSSIAALTATWRHSIALLNLHLGLLALLLAAQVCLAAAVATHKGDDGSGSVVPDMNHSGGYSLSAGATGGVGGGDGSKREELRTVLLAYKWADAVALTLETVTLCVGCLLHSAYMRADERAEDLEEGLVADGMAPHINSRRHEIRQQQQQAAEGHRAQLPPRVVRDDAWSRRMREQYGLDTARLSYDPLLQQQQQQQYVAGSPSQPSRAAAASAGEAAAAFRSRCIIS